MIAKHTVAATIVAELVPYMERHGVRLIGSPSIAIAEPLRAQIAGLDVLYLPKTGRLSKTPPPQLIEIRRTPESEKLFSAWFPVVDVVSFKRGGWIDDLLAALRAEAESRVDCRQQWSGSGIANGP